MEHLLKIEYFPPYTVITFQTASLMGQGELDYVTQAMEKLVDDGSHTILLDMSKVHFLASQGIGLLLRLKRKVDTRSDGTLVVCGLSPQLQQLLKLTRVDKVLNIKKTREDAFGLGARH